MWFVVGLNLQKDVFIFYVSQVLNYFFGLYLQAQLKLELQAWWNW